ncbi:MAG: hypothetical protein J4A00_00325 [Gammaproteobacteria bacterium]|nr:hypothetical protein [Gammaproteobacteria bacterium]
MWRLLLLVLMLLGALNWWRYERPVDPGPGVLAPEVPRQRVLVNAAPVRLKGFTMMPLASFALDARVLSREDYHWDTGARVSPTDLVLGWGPMSDGAVLDQIRISQRSRWYRWRVKQFPIPQRAIEIHSANMHLIPADDGVRRRMQSIRVGQVVSIEGALVEVNGEDGWRWRSSMTRNDVGDGACELILVKQIRVR